MELGEDNVTFLSLPPNFQTVENQAMGYAIDRQVRKLSAFCKKISVWSNLDHVDERYYDVLAASLRAPYYSPEYDKETKLRILKASLRMYKYAGTRRAVEDLIGQFFPNAEYIPWYQYSGKPKHFKIVVDTDPSPENVSKFATILKRVKSCRSVLDGLETKTYKINMDVYVATGHMKFERLEEM